MNHAWIQRLMYCYLGCGRVVDLGHSGCWGIGGLPHSALGLLISHPLDMGFIIHGLVLAVYLACSDSCAGQLLNIFDLEYMTICRPITRYNLICGTWSCNEHICWQITSRLQWWCKGYKPTIDVWIMQACFDHKCVPDKQNTAPTTREFQKIIIGTQKWPPA
jgi:hypothetical protein